MNRKMFSLAGIFVAIVALAIDVSPVHALGRRYSRSCQAGCQPPVCNPGFYGITHGRPFGDGGLYGGAPQVGGIGSSTSTEFMPSSSGYSSGYSTRVYAQPTYVMPTPVNSAPVVAPTPATSAPTPTPISK